jgi:hypothetical protein
MKTIEQKRLTRRLNSSLVHTSKGTEVGVENDLPRVLSTRGRYSALYSLLHHHVEPLYKYLVCILPSV